MSAVTKKAPLRRPRPDPAIAELFPVQGDWTEEEYLDLETKRLVEFDNGWLEVLPMPLLSHACIAFLLARLLADFADRHGLGIALPAGLPIRLWEGKFRKPDVLFMLARHKSRMKTEYWEGADLVMEVVSPSARDRERDKNKKRREYARAGIAEYCIVDPKERCITVLRLKAKKYEVAGTYQAGATAKSVLLPGFAADVDQVLGAK